MRAIIAQVNALDADMIVVAGDVLPDRNLACQHLKAHEIVPLLRPLRAPLGVFSVLGNHDWRDCRQAMETGGAENSVVEAFSGEGMALLRNESRQLSHLGYPFWVVGFDSQIPLRWGQKPFVRPDEAFAQVPEGAPAILLAHEPDYFAKGDTRPILQISGHTHGGQFVLLGRRPMTPSRYGDRYSIGHIVEGGRHLIVSAGIGYSGMPFRFGVPPEIVVIEVVRHDATTTHLAEIEEASCND